MPFQHHACVSVDCDVCGDSWDDEAVCHFASVDEAREELRRHEWLVTDDRLACPSCALQADCAATGHQHEPWQSETVNGVTYRHRLCDHCGSKEFDPPYEQLDALLHLALQINRISTGPEREGGPN